MPLPWFGTSLCSHSQLGLVSVSPAPAWLLADRQHPFSLGAAGAVLESGLGRRTPAPVHRCTRARLGWQELPAPSQIPGSARLLPHQGWFSSAQAAAMPACRGPHTCHCSSPVSLLCPSVPWEFLSCPFLSGFGAGTEKTVGVWRVCPKGADHPDMEQSSSKSGHRLHCQLPGPEEARDLGA